MDQSQGGNPFGRLIEFARPHKTGYIVSVVLAVLGVTFGIVPYFATARMTIELLSGNRDLSFYMVWCLISFAPSFLFSVIFFPAIPIKSAQLIDIIFCFLHRHIVNDYFKYTRIKSTGNNV